MVWVEDDATYEHLPSTRHFLDSMTLTLDPLGAPVRTPLPNSYFSISKYVTSLRKGSSLPPVSMTHDGRILLNRIGCMLYLKSKPFMFVLEIWSRMPKQLSSYAIQVS